MVKPLNGVPSLHEAFGEVFRIGAAVSSSVIFRHGPFISRHYNSITAENEMKMGEVHPSEEQYTFEAADSLFDFAEENGIGVRGHTLLWHNQTGDWIFQNAEGGACTKEELLERLRTHIETVAGRYRGRVYAWDVVNEAIEDKSDLYLRQSQWLDILGEDFIRHAFEIAHEVDPDAMLFYNDYNETDPVKRVKIYNLVRSLLDNNVPIHGIGMQAHWNIYGPSIEEIRESLELYASLGVKIHITELDLSVFQFDDLRADLQAPTKEMQELQEKRYEEIFRLFLEYKDVIDSVTFWGVADDYTWLDYFPVQGRKNWPFLFNERLEPKPVFWRVIGQAEQT